jgi:OmcA/MtrC family decaheme c-type cytochrome
VVLLATITVLAGCPPVTPPVVDDEPEPQTLAPGLQVVVEEVSFPADGRPEVVFRLQDGDGNAIALAELTDARFILAYLTEPTDGSTPTYVSYNIRTEGTPGGGEVIQATYDGAGFDGISINGDGTYTYKFADDVGDDFDASAAHQLAGQFERLYPVDGQEYPYNLIYPFLPGAGKQDVARREFVNLENCNACHTRLGFHGGARREVQLCIMCHSPQSTDGQSGNTLHFPTMIHKIHHGANLPSVQDGELYQLVGFRNTVHDYSEVHLPQDIRNCAVCHSDAPAGDVHLEMPTTAGCISCHDRTWLGDPAQRPEGFTQHTGGQQVDDTLCAVCHKPEGPAPAPIMEAHLLETQRPQAPGLAVAILDIESSMVEGGAEVALTFEAVDKTGSRITDLSELRSIGAIIGYPAEEYQDTIRESFSPGSDNLTTNADGSHTYVFETLLADTSISYGVALEARRSFDLDGASITQGTANNGLTFFTLDGSEPVMRREVVDEQQCNACHSEIRAHGGQRVGVSLCVMCHHVNATDIGRRPAEALPPETVNFKDMIHKIHTGAELNGEYTVYGFGGTAHDFTEVHFPGLRQECSVCHLEGTYEVPVPEEALATTITGADDQVIDSVRPERAACTSCHDSLISNIHAVLQTDGTTGVESCAVCHGSGAEFAVSIEHALAP